MIAHTKRQASAMPSRRWGQVSVARAYTEVFVVYVLMFGTGVIAAVDAWVHPVPIPPGPTPTLLNQLAGQGFGWIWEVGCCCTLCLVLAARRGWKLADLGVGPTRRPHRRAEAVAVAATLVVAMWTASQLFTLLAPHASYPYRATGPWGVVGAFGSSIRAGLTEELVVVAFTVTTLRQARRPWLEIIAVAYLERLGYHLYYATWWTLLWVATWGGVALALYATTNRLTALIAGHAAYDFTAMAATELGLHGRPLESVAVAAVVAMGIGWLLVYRSRGRRSPSGPPRPPGTTRPARPSTPTIAPNPSP